MPGIVPGIPCPIGIVPGLIPGIMPGIIPWPMLGIVPVCGTDGTMLGAA
jgi:hypothetical protein